MRVTMMLCDSAEVVNGKLDVRGGGWSVVPSPTPPSAIALKVEVPWDRADTPIHMDLELVDADGASVGTTQMDHDGISRPLDVPPGVPLDSALVVPLPSLPLAPGRYTWQLKVDGVPPDGGYVGFTVR